MATVPKWQQPLAERAATADERLRTAMLTAGGGQGALRAIVSGHRELAEIAHLLADRQSSPLVAELLRHGARALKTQADGYEHAVLNFADQADVEGPVWSTLDYSDEADELDEDQALVEPTSAPAVSSDESPTNGPEAESAQASLDDRMAVAQALADVAGGTVVHRGEVYEPAPEQPQSSLKGTTEHAHVGGSIGGVGDNDAHCSCGVIFAGFDTQDEALAVLHEHIEIERRVDECEQFGSRSVERTLSAAEAWESWATRLDALLDDLPTRPSVSWMDELGETCLVNLGIGHVEPRVIARRLDLTCSSADTIAAAYRRAARKAAAGTASTLQVLRGAS